MRHARVAVVVVVAAVYGGIGCSKEHETSVLEGGYQLPPGFTSIATSRTERSSVQLDAIYEDQDGTKLRFITARGSRWEVEPGTDPIDVCVRNEKTGKVLVASQFGDDVLIQGCGQTSANGAKFEKQIRAAVKSPQTVKFTREYRGEYEELVGLDGMFDSQRAMINEVMRDDIPSTPIYDGKTGEQIGVVKHGGDNPIGPDGRKDR